MEAAGFSAISTHSFIASRKLCVCVDRKGQYSKMATGSMARFLFPGKIWLLLPPTIFRLALGETSSLTQRVQLVSFGSKAGGTKGATVSSLLHFAELPNPPSLCSYATCCLHLWERNYYQLIPARFATTFTYDILWTSFILPFVSGLAAKRT
jgi:hypothetical protein